MAELFSSTIETTASGGAYFLGLLAALVCGIIAAAASSYKSVVSKSFAVALIVLPMIVQTVITMVNGSVGTGVAVMGAFSLVRFRSVPGKARDIASIFLAMTAGLACAAGYLILAVAFTMLVGAVLMVSVHIAFKSDRLLDLRITVPETLSFTGAFEEVFDKYTRAHRLVSTKTCNMGSLYKLYYKIELKSREELREFIDELRQRNGNLEVYISESAEGSDAL